MGIEEDDIESSVNVKIRFYPNGSGKYVMINCGIGDGLPPTFLFQFDQSSGELSVYAGGFPTKGSVKADTDELATMLEDLVEVFRQASEVVSRGTC